MSRSLFSWYFPILAGLFTAGVPRAFSQYIPEKDRTFFPDPVALAFDSLVASRIPLLAVSTDALGQSLPDSLDNSHYSWFPGILDQANFFACQQYCGTAYTFAYEMNRLRDVDGKVPENKYPPHYMWHFFNQGDPYIGVNFLHTFHAMMTQGHMTNADYGNDYAQEAIGWISGYDKYYRSMQNRIRNLFRIPVNSTQGILTVKQYLYDHLDGSGSGGVACFTASSPLPTGTGAGILPPGTPEAGKYVVTSWLPYATHGMTLVGYHDSIRFDLNQDGQYTNDLDITGDGTVDARDWEIGGFRAANSYGEWWADQGYFYILYHTMACGFEAGGPWNNCVYVVEPDPDYTPLLTLKIELEHTMREQLNILAGVSTDPQADFPEFILEPNIFSYQGGPLPMQGFDSIPEQRNLEFGLDVTPLLSYIEPGTEARFFLVIEEHDPSNTGQGILHGASFVHYGTETEVIPCMGTDIPVRNNGTMVVSGTATVDFPAPVILTEELPPLSATGTSSVQFQAQGGDLPYSWVLLEPYQKSVGGASYQPFTDLQVFPQSNGKPYVSVSLPFPFPFYGEHYTTVFMNAYGMIQFTSEHLPYPYLCSVSDMFHYIPGLAPCFSWDYTFRQGDGDGMWLSVSPDSVRFRWKVSILGEEPQTNVEFGVTLFPDGKVSYCYGPVQTGSTSLLPWTGISGGDPANSQIMPIFESQALPGQSCTWIPPVIPGTISVTRDGYLTVDGASTDLIYNIPVQVTDGNGISSVKDFQLSDGLLVRHTLVSPSGHLNFQEPATLDITLSNIGSSPLGPVELRFSCGHAGLLISDSLAASGILEPGQSTVIEDAFSMLLESNLPDQTPIPCSITSTAPGKTWETSFFLQVSSPLIQLISADIHDGVNGVLEAGETADLMVSLSNMGSWPATDLNVSLSGGDDFVQIVSSPSISIGSLGQKEMYDAFFALQASRGTPPGHEIDFELQVSNASGIDLTYPIHLRAGLNPVAMLKLSPSTTTSGLMMTILDSLQIGYDYFTSIPGNLHEYSCAFFILGASYTGSTTLSTEETNQLIGYLLNGGNVYMESYASWYYGTAELLQPLFMFYTNRVSVYYFNDLAGVDGTFTEGMSFPYEGSAPYAIFEVLTKGEGFPILTNTDTPPRCIGFAYAGDVYRTIGTFAELGKFVDSEPPSQKALLFRKYLEFLRVNIDGPFPFFHADTTHLCQWHTVHFTDDSFDGITSWQWEFPGGEPAWSTEQNPVVTYHSAGVYDVILTVSDGQHAQSMHKKRYIYVTPCTGTEELSPPAVTLRLFPNPASSAVSLYFVSPPDGPVTAKILDLQGRVALSFKVLHPENQTVSLDVSDLSPGMYLLLITGEGMNTSTKLVIY